MKQEILEITPHMSGLHYKPFEPFSDIERYIEDKDIPSSDFKDRKAIGASSF